jgi:hypothetical protein
MVGGFRAALRRPTPGRALGVGLDGEDVVVRYTWTGDATLDGQVTIADLGVLAANWQGTERRWSEGDFNYDGTVNIADLEFSRPTGPPNKLGCTDRPAAEVRAKNDSHFKRCQVPIWR